MSEKITSLKNPKIVHVRKLIQDKKYREECGEFVVEGQKFINEIPKEQISYILLNTKAKRQGFAFEYSVQDTILNKVSDTETSQGIIAVVKQPKYSLNDIKPGKWIIVEGIQDPGNLGTIIRTIEAAGAQGVIYTNGTVDPYSPKVVRSSAGSALRIPIIKVKNIEAVKKSCPDMKLIATVITGGKDYKTADYSSNCGIILGSEGQGLLEKTLAIVDEKVSIPLKGKTESLNVASTAAILLFR
ncbi:MAG: RNA methyltransferase [Candidatus Margulisbacteria bacterium]|nr:RNA methyltransferase [Candidatus Margulisiibacteriota bacterium]